MGHTFDDPKLLSADRRVQLVYATTFYTEQRTWPDKTTICPVGKRNIIVTETYNTSFAAKADGLIYYGPDLYHTNLPPFGDGTKDSAGWGHTSLPVPLMHHREPRKNRQVPIWFTEEPPQSSGAVELNSTAMRNFLVYMGFHPQQALTRDGTVCYSGWG